MFRNLFILILLSFSLASCFPSIFTATTTAGVTAAQDRSFGDAVDDTTIWASIKTKLMKKGMKNLFKNIDITVIEGRVLLVGTVDSEDEILELVELSWTQKGVREVINELKVKSGEKRSSTYVNDCWITSRIKTKMITTGGIKHVNYTIVTNESVVYIFGLARSQGELDKVNNIAATIKGVGKVKNYARLLDSKERYKSLSIPKSENG